jgi:riboflavin synthase
VFTGLVETTALVTDAAHVGAGMRLAVEAAAIAPEATLGESICVSGCCLSVVTIDDTRLSFDLGPETLARTTLGGLSAGRRVNLERSLRLGDRLGGHLVTGHVDGIGHLASREDLGDWSTFRFAAPGLACHLVPKGSVAVDGVSLTVCETSDVGFSVQLIPHTLAITTLGRLVAGDPVNLETDLIGKLVERQVTNWLAQREGR